MVATSILDCVGHTPCLKIAVPGGSVFAKAEFLNPGGSVKDRVVRHILDEAERAGELKPDMRIAEATSGNTGIALAMAGAARGYMVTIFMPETASLERQKMIRYLGAELVLTPAEESVSGAVNALQALLDRDQNVFTICQFCNRNNIAAHYLTTAEELWKELDGKIDCFISGVGSGGTLMGVAQFLKERSSSVSVVAVDPKGASVLLGHKAACHKIEGIGDGFIPEILDPGVIDRIVEIDEREAVRFAARLARQQGVMAGISSGANLAAASLILREHPDWRVSTLLPDRAERYFSTELFAGQS